MVRMQAIFILFFSPDGKGGGVAGVFGVFNPRRCIYKAFSPFFMQFASFSP